MTATLISLLSVIVGILGANFTGSIFRKYSFGLIGNTIVGVFGSVLLVKSLDRLGFDPASIVASGSVSWLLFIFNIIVSFSGGAFALILMKLIQREFDPNKKKQKSSDKTL